jgi:hypothetical protein
VYVNALQAAPELRDGIVLAVPKANSPGGKDFSIKFHAEQADSAEIQSAVFLRTLRVLHVNGLGEP